MEENLLLIVAAVLFIMTHLGISRTSFRKLLVEVLGENGYLAFYSLVAFASLGALIYQYGEVSHQHYLWQPSVVTSSIPKLIMPLALILIVLGVSSKNPTSLKMESAVDQEPQGILRITRHPVQWGIMLWALSHLVSNGDNASLVFFLSFVVVSGFGMSAIDRKKTLSLDADKWKQFIAVTSIIPFAAIASGRNQFKMNELGWVKILISLVLYVILIYAHGYIASIPLYEF
jgi:uncharacterized membrane protein